MLLSGAGEYVHSENYLFASLRCFMWILHKILLVCHWGLSFTSCSRALHHSKKAFTIEILCPCLLRHRWLFHGIISLASRQKGKSKMPYWVIKGKGDDENLPIFSLDVSRKSDFGARECWMRNWSRLMEARERMELKPLCTRCSRCLIFPPLIRKTRHTL